MSKEYMNNLNNGKKIDIRLIALDLDGTLLNSDKQLSPRNRTALFQAAQKGILIVPTTGRLPGALSPAVSADFHFLQGVPGPTGRAFARPVGCLVAAGRAAINCLLFCHNILRLSGADEPCSILQIGSHQYR